MATKKAPPAKTPAPKVSSITKAAEAAIKKNPKRRAFAASLAVIKELQKRADKPAIVKFLEAAYKEVKLGGGQDGGDNADPNGPSTKPGGDE